jgi:hypothetical protein
MVNGIMAGAVTVRAGSIDCLSERKAFLTKAYEDGHITGPLLQSLILQHGLEGA